jgi:hypothetical protein
MMTTNVKCKSIRKMVKVLVILTLNLYLTQDYRNKLMDTQMLVIFALVAALGLVTVVAVDLVLTMQEADAAGCRTSQAVNASKGRCFKG